MDHPFAPELLIESRGAVRIVTLNRPEALNAANPALHRALVRVWTHLAEDEDARAVVVITGADRVFSAGGDFELLMGLWDDQEKRRREMEDGRRLLTEMVDFPLPLVAAVNGPAVGLGCNIAVCSDVVPIAQVQSTKRALNMHTKRAIAGVLEYALASEFQSFDTAEHRELVTGFVERARARAARG